ncbi:MAG: PaaI family thioesterase [Iamia sp.]
MAASDADELAPGEMPLGGFNEALGLEFVTVSGDEVVIRLPIGPHLHQPYGIVHGGVWCGAVETAASVGAAMWLGDKGNVVGVSNHTDFLKAVREGVVTVRATPIHRGRLQQLWLVELHDDTERLVARGQVRLQNLEDADAIGRSKG